MKKFIIGIDFSKETVDASIVQKEQPETLIAYKKFRNNLKGVDGLIAWAKSKVAQDGEIIFCGENTGTYSTLFSDELTDRGFIIWIEHSMNIVRGMGDVRGKDDKTDSLRIASYAARFYDKMKPYVRPKDETRVLKTLLAKRDRLKSFLKAEITNTKENPLMLQDSNIASSINEFFKRLEESLRKELKELERMILDVVMSSSEYAKNFNILTSMKGIGLINAVALIVYTDNFTKFNFNHRKIATYWGVVPFKNESGTSVRRGTHVSPKCNSWLKALLTEATLCAIRYNSRIKAYHDRLMARGKAIGIVLNNCKNKMLKILVAMVRDSKIYSDMDVSKDPHTATTTNSIVVC